MTSEAIVVPGRATTTTTIGATVVAGSAIRAATPRPRGADGRSAGAARATRMTTTIVVRARAMTTTMNAAPVHAMTTTMNVAPVRAMTKMMTTGVRVPAMKRMTTIGVAAAAMAGGL